MVDDQLSWELIPGGFVGRQHQFIGLSRSLTMKRFLLKINYVHWCRWCRTIAVAFDLSRVGVTNSLPSPYDTTAIVYKIISIICDHERECQSMSTSRRMLINFSIFFRSKENNWILQENVLLNIQLKVKFFYMASTSPNYNTLYLSMETGYTCVQKYECATTSSSNIATVSASIRLTINPA